MSSVFSELIYKSKFRLDHFNGQSVVLTRENAILASFCVRDDPPCVPESSTQHQHRDEQRDSDYGMSKQVGACVKIFPVWEMLPGHGRYAGMERTEARILVFLSHGNIAG